VHWASAVSQFPEAERAVTEVLAVLTERLAGAAPDLVCLFVSFHHQEAWLSIGKRLGQAFPGALLFGCTGASVIGDGRELEDGPGLAVSAGVLPGVRLLPFHVADGSLPELPLPEDAHVQLLADPWSSSLETLLPALDARFAGTVVGGVASAGQQPGHNLLFLGEGTARSGVVCVGLHGDLRLDAVVSQGCRPVGPPLFATGCDGNVLYELDGRRPIDVLNELFEGASAEDQELFRNSLFMGLQMSDAQNRFEPGDFLVRNLMGADEDSGALHVAAQLTPGHVVRFHLRDRRAADEDLARRLDRCAAEGDTPRGALLFSCLGRGQGLYGEPDHDSRAFAERVGRLPLAGFFGNGEIGPVEGRSFLHGYTSAFGLFRPGR
jgi:small ligand-binding sensory domain FIST